ncbi:MAG: hypothetical protein ISS15_09890 [Alphaproteobacteria bacterium]|nr:hypothetical protein [Alphaproteobacteria bacterium]MBL6938684.1 hypothetical protein [Alphaproteobacteria bacterium]MBL7097959.1 hypothetical protein [Alphaproteobacteria bacterium]
MAIDRTVRLLTSLNRASTSRVLNLAMIAAANASNEEHRASPLFVSPAINSCILLKHRVRTDDAYVLGDNRSVATKIIIPFDLADLKAGGRSFFVGQKGFRDILQEVGQYRETGMDHDLEVLRLIDRVPSLDPFLLRERLRAHQIQCADSYFEINPADQQRMHAYVSAEVHKLIQLATGSGAEQNDYTARLVSALLSTEVDEKLEPLRETLAMEPDDFREGVFSWRGFLYYKWSLDELWPRIVKVLREVKQVEPIGAVGGEARSFLAQSRVAVIQRVRDCGLAVRKILKVYDSAFEALVSNNTPTTFRDFLLSAPHLFVDLGEKMGAISHIVSFWRYRFPEKSRLAMDCEELASIFQDFTASFSSVVAGDVRPDLGQRQSVGTPALVSP